MAPARGPVPGDVWACTTGMGKWYGAQFEVGGWCWALGGVRSAGGVSSRGVGEFSVGMFVRDMMPSGGTDGR